MNFCEKGEVVPDPKNIVAKTFSEMRGGESKAVWIFPKNHPNLGTEWNFGSLFRSHQSSVFNATNFGLFPNDTKSTIDLGERDQHA